MFIVNPKPTFKATVTFSVPGETGRETGEFGARFKYFAKDEYDALMERTVSDEALVREVTVEITDVCDPDKRPLPMPEALDAVLKLRGMATVMAAHFIDGNRAAPEKNL